MFQRSRQEKGFRDGSVRAESRSYARIIVGELMEIYEHVRLPSPMYTQVNLMILLLFLLFSMYWYRPDHGDR